MESRAGLFKIAALLLILTAAVPLAVMAANNRPFSAETRLSDLWFRTRLPRAPRPDMVIVARDEKTLDQIGEPSHAEYGALVRKLTSAGAKLIVLDLDLDEREGRAGDRALWTAIEASRRTLMMVRYQQDRTQVPGQDELRGLRALERSAPWQEFGLAGGTPEWGWLNFAPATSDFIHSAHGAGVAVTEQSLDPDDVLRRSRAGYLTKVLYPLDTEQGKLTNFYAVVPNLAVITAVTAMGGDKSSLDFRFGETLRFGAAKPQPLAAKGFVPVDYIGQEGTYPRVSMVDVLRDEADEARLKDRIVFVGSTVPTDPLTENRKTPLGSRMPRVEATANQTQQFLEGRVLTEPHVLGAWAVMVLGLMLGLVVPQFRAAPSLLAGLGALLLYLGMGWVLFAARSVMLPVLPALILAPLAVALTAVLALLMRPYAEARVVEVRDTGMALNPGEPLPGTRRRPGGGA